MLESDKTAVQQAGAPYSTTYELDLQEARQDLERATKGKIVVKARDRDLERTRQGTIRFYLNPMAFPDTALMDFKVFLHEIKTHSGKHRHQGGLVIYVLEGKGYTVVDGERVDWEEGDLLLLPLKPEGVEHQHFNGETGKTAKWLAFIFMPFWRQLASGLEQREEAPGFRA